MGVTAEVSFTDRFWRSVYELAAPEIKQVVKAIEQLSKDPANGSLQLHPVQGDKTRRKYTCRANEDVRILLLKQGDLFLLDRAGHHDAMYELSARVDLVFNQGTGRIVVTDRAEAAARYDQQRAGEASPKKADPDARGLFDHWADTDLAEAGVDPEEVTDVRTCATEDDLLNLAVDDETLNLLIDLLGKTPEQWRTPPIDAEAATTEVIREAIVEQGTLGGLSALFTASELEDLLAGPIEDWMIFLHPNQGRVADRTYEGPARVRGSAGTGKERVRRSWRSTERRHWSAGSGTIRARPGKGPRPFFSRPTLSPCPRCSSGYITVCPPPPTGMTSSSATSTSSPTASAPRQATTPSLIPARSTPRSPTQPSR